MKICYLSLLVVSAGCALANPVLRRDEGTCQIIGTYVRHYDFSLSELLEGTELFHRGSAIPPITPMEFLATPIMLVRALMRFVALLQVVRWQHVFEADEVERI